jgi:hypothetical protein
MLKSLQEIRLFQFFLIGQNFNIGRADGIIGSRTTQGIIDFQKKHGLQADGVVGKQTFIKALELGFMGDLFPLKPNFNPIVATAGRQRLFGKFDWERAHDLTGEKRDDIIIKGNWERDNIVLIEVPQLIPIRGNPNVRCHRLVAKQTIDLFAAWEREGLMKYVLSWHGMYNPRFIRGREGVLSNHAFGSAFDINLDDNMLGALPALVGRKGSVRLLVETANEFGFYWGGHFSRRDGMHFEIAKILK